MEIKKQVPSITVNIRVPEPIFNRLEAVVFKNQVAGKKVSKNSVYVEALSTYLDVLDEIGEGIVGEEGLSCVMCGKRHMDEVAEVGAGLTDVNGKMICSKCLMSVMGEEFADG